MTATKITRSQIKSIVKECLVEILQEGIGNYMGPVQPQPQVSSPSAPVFQEGMQRKPKSAYLDTPVSTPRPQSNQQALKNMIKNEARGNPIMEDIFSDTAKRTLPGFLSESGTNKIAQQEQFQGDPQSVFGEDVASKWALLAFSETKNKNMT